MNKIKKISTILGIFLLTLTLQAQEDDFIQGQVLIQLKDKAYTQKSSIIDQMKATCLKSYPNLDFELWELKHAKDKQSTLQLIEQFKNHSDVEFVEPNYLWKVTESTEPNDQYFSEQWGLHNLGQNGGTVDADIDAPEAYALSNSRSEIVVGIIDIGIDYTHEDLAENIWNNLGEDADGDGKVLIQSGNTWIFDPDDENGIDDDGNGYIDDFIGWDFAYNDNDPMDLNSHGTHNAGTIGAIINNNTGISGVAPNVKLAALKFLTESAIGSTADAIEALNYAVSMGMPISNNSWGGAPFSEALYQALQNAEGSNHLFVTSSGNNSLNTDIYPIYPASYNNDNIIAVLGTNRNDTIPLLTNYGMNSVDIGAPGQEIYSCMPGNGYNYKSGTAMATGCITGVCAFVWGAYPESSYTIIKDAIMNSVDPLPALNGKCVSGGRVNMHKAMLEMDNCGEDCVSNVYPGDINLDGIVNNQDDALLFLKYNYNGNAIPREETGFLWQPYSCSDWGFEVPEANCNDIKHFDCNGDGSINFSDKNAIIANWDSTHVEPNYNCPPIYPLGNFPTNNKIYLQPTGNVNNGLLIMDIVLEHIEGNDLEMYGGFFTIQYPSPTVTEADVVFSSSWLGFPNNNLNMDYKDFPIQQKVEVGFSRTNGTNAIGSGIIGQVAFSINENLRSGNSEQVLDFDAINIGAHNNVGEPIAISNQYQPVNIGAVNCEPSITINQTTPFQNLYQSSGTIQTSSNLIVGQNQQVQYNANRVTLNDGFSVRVGADFKVRSNGCN